MELSSTVSTEIMSHHPFGWNSGVEGQDSTPE
jgi:hypothetical protein